MSPTTSSKVDLDVEFDDGGVKLSIPTMWVTTSNDEVSGQLVLLVNGDKDSVCLHGKGSMEDGLFKARYRFVESTRNNPMLLDKSNGMEPRVFDREAVSDILGATPNLVAQVEEFMHQMMMRMGKEMVEW